MKKIICFLLTIILAGNILFPSVMTTHAEESSLSLSKSSVVIGKTVTVTISIPEGTNAEIDLEYPSSLLQYESADQDVGVYDGVITIILGKFTVGSSSVTLTFKAKTTGEGEIKSVVTKAYKDDTTLIEMSGKTAKITVENESVEETKSADNSLKYIKLSSGTLSPDFKYNIVNYTATVPYEVTSLVIDAKTSNSKAKIESVTGHESLKVGENVIKIVVVAENGTKATYKIVVTRLEKQEENNGGNEGGNEGGNSGGDNQEPEKEGVKFTYIGQELETQNEIPQEMIPADFSETTKVISGQEVGVLQFDKGDLTLLYLENPQGYGSLYVYDDVEKDVYPFIQLKSEKSYVIILRPSVETTMEGYKQCTLSIEGKGTIIAFQKEKYVEESKNSGWKKIFPGPLVCNAATVNEEEFYLLYCLNNNGEVGWYMYDSAEGTYQRYIKPSGAVQDNHNEEITNTDVEGIVAMNAQLRGQQERMQMIMYVLLGAVAVLMVALVVVTIVGLRNTKIESEEEQSEVNKSNETKRVNEVKEKERRHTPYGALKRDADDEVIKKNISFGEEKEAVMEEPEITEAKLSEDKMQTQEIRTDDFDVEVSINDAFPGDEEEYEDEDLEIFDV